MTTFAPPESTLNDLKDKVVVLTGGSSGIGAAIVRLLHSLGALTVFGDIDSDNADKLMASLSNAPYPRANASFVSTDVTSYASNLALFEHAESKHGHIDHALAIAGVAERGDWFGPSLDRETVKNCPPMLTLDINLMGVLYFSRIALAFMSGPKPRTEDDVAALDTEEEIMKRILGEGRLDGIDLANLEPEQQDELSDQIAEAYRGRRSIQNRGSTGAADRSLTIMASSTSFRPHTSALYCTSKHAVLGLARSLHAGAGKARGIRVNAVLPWLVGSTNLNPGDSDAWRRAGLALNEPEDVARVTRELLASSDLSGKAIYIAEGKAWDLLESMERTSDIWWGPGLKDAYDEDERKRSALRDRGRQPGRVDNRPA